MARATAEQRARVHRLLGRVVDDVTQLPEGVLGELMPSLRAAQKELENDLAFWLQRVDGSHRFTAHQYRTALRQIRESMRAIGELKPKLRTALERGSKSAAGLSNRWLSREMARLSDVFGGEKGLVGLDLPTTAHLLDKNKWLVNRFAKSAARYTSRAQKALRRQLSIGVLRGESIDQMTERLMRLSKNKRGYYGLSGGGAQLTAQQMAKGLFKGRYFEAERLVRTELMNAYNAHHQRAIEVAAEDEPDMKRRWDSSADRRRCVLCRELDGEVRAVDEEFTGGIMYGPRHPYCRCVIIPWMAHWGDVASPPVTGPPDTVEPPPIVEVRPPPPPPPPPPPVAKPPPVAPKPKPKAPPVEAMRASDRAMLDSLQSGSSDITPARDAIEADLRGQGFRRYGGQHDFSMTAVQDLPALGYHHSDGRVELRTTTADEARRFLETWRKNPAAVRRRLEDVSTARSRRDQLVAKRDELLDKRAGAKKKDKPQLTEAIGRVQGEIDGINEVVKVAGDSDGYKTIVHEVIHGYGPRALQAYHGVGAVVEEVTTEVLARRMMKRRFGIPHTAMLHKHASYGKAIEPIVDGLAAVRGVPRDRARRWLEDASESYKRDSKTVVGPEAARELFFDHLELTARERVQIGRIIDGVEL